MMHKRIVLVMALLAVVKVGVAQSQGINLVPNPSIFPGANLQPTDWAQGNWGENDAQFTYLPTGQDGNGSLRVSMTTYSSGDAKWYFTPISVEQNRTYLLSDWYRSDVTTTMVVRLTDALGGDSYRSLGTVPPSAGWSQTSFTFTTSATTSSVTVFHLLAGVGSLTTDSYSLTPVLYKGFRRGIVTLSFDDGWASIFANGLPLLRQFGYKSTQYIATGLINTPGYMVPANVKQLANEGHEIGAHSISHPDLTTLPWQEQLIEIGLPRWQLQQYLKLPVTTFAYPYSTYNDQVVRITRAVYSSARTTDVGWNDKSMDLYRLRAQEVHADTTEEEFQGWLDVAARDRVWLVLAYHNVAADSGLYAVTPAQLASQLTKLKAKGLPVLTMSQALTELVPQMR